MAEIVEVVSGAATVEVLPVPTATVIEVVEQGRQGPPGPDTEAAIASLVADDTPHPVYDEAGITAVLLFENALI